MIRRQIVGLSMLCGLVSCSRQAPPENNPLMAPVKALEQAKALEGQIMQQAEQQKRVLDAAEK